MYKNGPVGLSPRQFQSCLCLRGESVRPSYQGPVNWIAGSTGPLFAPSPPPPPPPPFVTFAGGDGVFVSEVLSTPGLMEKYLSHLPEEPIHSFSFGERDDRLIDLSNKCLPHSLSLFQTFSSSFSLPFMTLLFMSFSTGSFGRMRRCSSFPHFLP